MLLAWPCWQGWGSSEGGTRAGGSKTLLSTPGVPSQALGRTRSPWAAAAPRAHGRVSPSLKDGVPSFLTGMFQAGCHQLKAGWLGRSSTFRASQCSFLPVFPSLWSPLCSCSIFVCVCVCFLGAEAAFGCLGAGGRQSWLHTYTYITGVSSLCTPCTSRFL